MEVPTILGDIFTVKENVEHNLRINNLLKLPTKCSTQTYGLHSFHYRGCATWNALPDHFKTCDKSSKLKILLRSALIKCTCKICLVK